MGVVLAIVITICAVIFGLGWFLTSLSRRIILYCWIDRGYPKPTQEELDKNSREAVYDIFTRKRKKES